MNSTKPWGALEAGEIGGIDPIVMCGGDPTQFRRQPVDLTARAEPRARRDHGEECDQAGDRRAGRRQAKPPQERSRTKEDGAHHVRQARWSGVLQGPSPKRGCSRVK